MEDDEAGLACVEELQLPLPPEMAELVAMAQDRGLQEAHERWRVGFEAAMVQQARTLAARGDARSLLAAAMIFPIAYDETTGQPLPAAADESVGWFEAARHARPADPLVAWLEASGCPIFDAARCDSDAGLARLLQVDGDNATVQWLAVNAALQADDPVAARTHLRLAAEATRFEPYGNRLMAMLLEARSAAPLPPLDEDAGRVLGATMPLGRPATNDDVIGMLSMAQWAAYSMPALSAAVQLCGAGQDQPGLDAALRQDCTASMAKLAGNDSMLIYPSIALPLLIELASGPERAAWQARLREHVWLSEQFVGLLTGSRPGVAVVGMETHAQAIADDGEVSAARQVLQRNGIPLQPLSGWQPGNPGQRALLAPDLQPAG
ncbi:MAG: hypothetical protein ACREO4_05305 [Lysobacter sp.]